MPKTKRGYEALNSFRQYERNKYVSQSEEDKALLEDMVSKMQIVDKDVLKALSNMPTEVIRELRAKNTAQEMENERIKKDLAYYGCGFDSWISEKWIVSQGMVEKAVEKMDEMGLLYNQDGAIWFAATK